MRAAIVMSRMPRLIAPDAAWLSGLRAGLRRIRDEHQTLIVTPGTAGSDFVRRGAERLGVASQFVQAMTVSDAASVGADAGSIRHEATSDEAVRDRQLIERVDEVFVLGIRPQGNLHRLLLDRLNAGRRGIFLVDLPGLQPATVKNELMSLGAESWTPHDEILRPIANVGDGRVEPIRNPNDTLLPFSAIPPDQTGQYLTHTTRACPGPWPEQAVEEYFDGLLDSRPEGDHSALNTLLRIVCQQRLIGSARTIRGGYPAVSFTGVDVRELPGLRCFRSHRTRWDFEPYAVSIRREALERRGARPVIYGGEETWGGLTDADRPYFQLSGAAESSIDETPHVDWSVEREWRYPGNLDLSHFTADDVILFVPNVAAARRLYPYAPWPITLWPAEV